MSIIKITKYRCNRCHKTFDYPKLIQERTITINNKEYRYTHYCPICRNDTFILFSTIIKN